MRPGPEPANETTKIEIPLPDGMLGRSTQPRYEQRTQHRKEGEAITLSGELLRMKLLRDDILGMSRELFGLFRLEWRQKGHQQYYENRKYEALSVKDAERLKLSIMELQYEQDRLLEIIADLQCELDSISLGSRNSEFNMLWYKEDNESADVKSALARIRNRFDQAVEACKRTGDRLDPSPNDAQTEINLVLVGKTGVGISTLINGMHNLSLNKELGSIEFIMPLRNGEWVSSFLAQPFGDPGPVEDMGISQTKKIYKYTIQHDGVTVNLFDTPGVGSTWGYDPAQIAEMLIQPLEGVKVDGIVIVLRESGNLGETPDVAQIKSMLPKAFQAKLMGAFNTHSIAENIRRYCARRFHELFTPENSERNSFFFDVNIQIFPEAELASLKESEIESFREAWELSRQEMNGLLNYAKALKGAQGAD